MRDLGSTLGLGRFPGEGNSYSLQYFCLENSTDKGAWWAIVYGVAKSQTQLTFSFYLQQISMRLVLWIILLSLPLLNFCSERLYIYIYIYMCVCVCITSRFYTYIQLWYFLCCQTKFRQECFSFLYHKTKTLMKEEIAWQNNNSNRQNEMERKLWQEI